MRSWEPLVSIPSLTFLVSAPAADEARASSHKSEIMIICRDIKPSLFIKPYLDAMVQGRGDLVDVLQIRRQERVEVDPFAPGNGHALRPVAEVAGHAHRLRVNTLRPLVLAPPLGDRLFQPYLVAVPDAFFLSRVRVHKHVVRMRFLADLVDPGILVAEAAVDVGQLVVDRD